MPAVLVDTAHRNSTRIKASKAVSLQHLGPNKTALLSHEYQEKKITRNLRNLSAHMRAYQAQARLHTSVDKPHRVFAVEPASERFGADVASERARTFPAPFLRSLAAPTSPSSTTSSAIVSGPPARFCTRGAKRGSQRLDTRHVP